MTTSHENPFGTGYGWVYTPRKLANRTIYALSNNNTFILDPDGILRV
jgi:hypothetical protein